MRGAAPLCLAQHVRGAIDAHDFVAALSQRHGVSTGATAQIENFTNGTLAVELKCVLDQINLGQVILVAIQVVIGGGVLRAEHALDHRSAARRTWHTRSSWRSSMPRPDGRYNPWRASRSATG